MGNPLTLANLFSTGLLFLAALYMIFGTYTVTLSPKGRLNQLFLVVCSLLSLWSFSYALAFSAPNEQTAYFWFRIGVFGWALVYSVLLHFFLELTEHKEWLNKKWVMVVLYLPALINIGLFGIFSPWAHGYYDLIYSKYGWINVSEPGTADLFFHSYYLLFSLMGIWILWKWKKTKQNPDARKTVMVIIFSFGITILIGTLIDVLFSRYYGYEIPQLGTVFALLMTVAFFYAVKKHGLMMNRPKSSITEEGEILSEKRRVQFYNMMGAAFIIGSLLNYGDYLFKGEPFLPVNLFSGILFLFGIAILLLPHIGLANHRKDIAMMTLVTCSIPLMMLYYLHSSSSNIIWPAPLIFMMISAVFTKKMMLVMITISALISQLYFWMKVPSHLVMVNTGDHISRLTIYLLGAVVALYVNRVYSQRLKENEEKTRMQRMIAELSLDFVSVNPENLDERVNRLLEKAGIFFQVDRCYLFCFSEDGCTVTYTHEWCAEGIEPAIQQVGTLPVSYVPWWINQLEKNRSVYIPDTRKMPPEAQAEKEILEMQQIKSLLSLPVSSHGKTTGFLGFDSVKEHKEWERGHQEALQILANLISDALIKVKAVKEISQMAYYDSLTGLCNRRMFKQRLTEAISMARRSRKKIGILFLDLDAFKAVNDTMGHDKGDQLLKKIAKRISERVREHDTVCRFGGDEFLIMFPQIDHATQVMQAAEKIINDLKQPVVLEGHPFFVTASGGISVYPFDGKDADTLIKNADLSMYTSKEQGKNQIHFCTPEMKEKINERAELIQDLHHALERKEFVLHYQPQVSVATKEIVGLEALIRWQHPTKGLIAPGQFIPLAEQTGLIKPIGRWVIETACFQSKHWQKMGVGKMFISVNLSVEQLRKDNMVEVVKKTLEKTKLDPSLLELEITETTAIKEPEYIVKTLHDLKELGVAISIDDFGTEYSSLSRLRELPIDRIKMAMQFVHAVTKGPKDEAIAVGVINLAKSIGLKVIAEGVEIEEQLAFLADRICDEAQGHYLYQPMSAEEIEGMFMNQVNTG
ncbi:diguanylate cyclase (GGDEF) domain-containing protein [Tindallia magadiensis]|uniref:Diguanylate cyclase (GGDEF) domain-containing protein n=1 Tax=Tindallia magadiensis TaxID=69895 RepID=A0A1I3BXC5_9FIRM|nr:EAL domain-containing protein [Tindallia magadiensis]SFH66863.1 diguanylate cyclase (GGDEF) domain-containing protein [Tindallia magadiensis]